MKEQESDFDSRKSAFPRDPELSSWALKVRKILHNMERALYVGIIREGRQMDRLFNNLAHNHGMLLNWPQMS